MRSTTILVGAVAGAVLAALAFRAFVPARPPVPIPAGERHEEAGHGEHDEDGGQAEGDRGSGKAVHLSDAERKEFGIEVGTAGPGELKVQVALPGEVAANADRLAHVVPPVPGIAREVRKYLGDPVRKGEVMAVLESRELADVKAAYLNASERVALAEATFFREEDLWKKKISAEQEYLEARRALAEARIELRSAEQKLHALGFPEEYLKQLPAQPDVSYTRFEIVAPFEGTVIEKHISLGEALNQDSPIFTIADLRTVWINLSVYQKDMPFVRRGQPVVISAGQGISDVRGEISYIGPVIGEETRTALARVVLPSRGGALRPGLFVTGTVTVDSVPVSVLVPKSAIQTIEEGPSIFVETDEGFVAAPVTVGRSNGTHVEITGGLPAGARYVQSGAFTLKAELSKGAFGGGHAH